MSDAIADAFGLGRQTGEKRPIEKKAIIRSARRCSGTRHVESTAIVVIVPTSAERGRSVAAAAATALSDGTALSAFETGAGTGKIENGPAKSSAGPRGFRPVQKHR